MPIALTPIVLHTPLPDSPDLCQALEAMESAARATHPNQQAHIHLEFERSQEGHLTLAFPPGVLGVTAGTHGVSSSVHTPRSFIRPQDSRMNDAWGKALLHLCTADDLQHRLIDIATRMAADTDPAFSTHTRDTIPGLYAPIAAVLSPEGALFYRPALAHLPLTPSPHGLRLPHTPLPPGLLRGVSFPHASAHGALRSHTHTTDLARAVVGMYGLRPNFTLAP